MVSREHNCNPPPDTHAQFPTTHWTQIRVAGGPACTESCDALNQLCQDYWYPVYAFLRRNKRYDPHTAKDRTQSFFVHLLAKELPKVADQNKGRFRSFLLTALDHFVTNEYRKEHAQMRGGKAQVISIDETQAEVRYGKMPIQEPDPTKLFDRAWAVTVIENVKVELKAACARRGRLAVYDALAPFLTTESNPDQYADLAARLQMTRETLQVTLRRLRDEFGDCLRRVIARTVKDPAEIDDEIRHLLASWSAGTKLSQ